MEADKTLYEKEIIHQLNHYIEVMVNEMPIAPKSEIEKTVVEKIQFDSATNPFSCEYEQLVQLIKSSWVLAAWDGKASLSWINLANYAGSF